MPTKTLATAVVLMVAIVWMPACTQTSESARIGQDGKGTITVRAVVHKQMTDGLLMMLKEMNMGQGSAAELFAMLEPESIKKRVEGKKGVKILESTKEEDEAKGTLTVTVKIGFDSLELLYASGALLGITAKLEMLPDGNYKFTRDFWKDRLPAADNPEGVAYFEGVIMFIEPYLKELEFSADMVFPTGVIETSGEKIAENHVRWVIKYGDLLNVAKRTQTVVFNGEGLDWKPFSAKATGPMDRTTPSEEKPSGPTTPSEEPTPPEEDKAKPDDDEAKPDDEADDTDG